MKETRTHITGASRGLLDHLRKHLRITGNDLDAELLQDLLAAASAAEHNIGQIIISSEFRLEDTFSSSLTLRRPLKEVTSVAVDGTTIEESKYTVDGNVLTIDDSIEGEEVVVEYKAGFDPIPADIVAAINLHASALFSNPLDSVETLPKASTNLLRPYRTWGLGK